MDTEEMVREVNKTRLRGDRFLVILYDGTSNNVTTATIGSADRLRTGTESLKERGYSILRVIDVLDVDQQRPNVDHDGPSR